MRYVVALGLMVVAVGLGSLPFVGCSGPAPQAEVKLDPNFSQTLDQCLDLGANRRLSAKQHAAWQVVHGILPYGRAFLIESEGKDVSALDYLFNEGVMNGWNLRIGEKGIFGLLEPGSVTGQGHPDQWIGYLSQIGLPLDAPLKVSGKSFTVRDFVTQAQWDIQEGMEATWTLMAFNVYVPLDAKWQNKDGQEWNIERLVGMECQKNNSQIYSGSCQGAHRLYALSKAVQRYQREKKPAELTGVWKTAQERVTQAIADAKANQNGDGTYSTAYFVRGANTPDPVDKIRAGGHVIEVLCVAMTDEQLKEPWVTRGILALTKLFKQTKNIDVECGALYHSANALKIYRERMYGPRSAADAAAPTANPATSETPAK